MCHQIETNFDQYDAQTLPEAIQVFLENGGNVNDMFKHKYLWKETPLFFAVSANSAPAVRLLLDAGADPNSTGDSKITPLHIACHSTSPDTLEIVKLLLDHGADLLSKDGHGSSPVHLAFHARNSRLVDMLLARLPKGANLSDNQDLTMFHIACAHGADQVVRDLLDNGVPIDDYTEDASRRIHLSGLKFAIMDNRRSTVELLLKRGADVRSTNAFGQTLLHSACEINSEKFVAHLNGQYVQMREDMEVSERDHLGIINLLLDHGVDVNATNESGLTPLLYLCTDRFTSTNKWRVSLSFPNESTMVREHRHMITRRRLIAQCLLKRGAAIDARSPDGRSLLHLEFECDFNRRVLHDDELIRLFVKYGADVNARDKRQFTPLHVNFDQAFYFNNSINSHHADRKIALLLLNGADVNARSADGLTPVTLFIKNFYGSEKLLRKCSRLILMLAHAQRMMLLGKTVDVEIKSWMKRLNLEELESSKKQCVEELERMKRDYIDDTTLYRMLRTGLDRADRYVSQWKLQQIMAELKVAKKYPNYAYLLELMVRKGSLLKRAESAVKVIAQCELPYLCTQVILKHLTDSDLKNLAKSMTTKSMTTKRKPSDCERVEPAKKKQRLQ